MPTKSGVVGLLAAAQGLRRDADLSKLNALKFGVRADREGEDITDFHTAKSEKSSYITYRHYLSDAVFLAAVEGDKDFLNELAYALQHPKFPLFLGRRSCPPTLPIVIGIKDFPLEKALEDTPSLIGNTSSWVKEKMVRVRIETDNRDAGMVQDLPISFDPRKRVYGCRKVKEYFVELKSGNSEQTELSVTTTEHDAMSELR